MFRARGHLIRSKLGNLTKQDTEFVANAVMVQHNRKLPEDLRDSPEIAVLRPIAYHKVYNLVQLIYRAKHYEGDSKDYEFSRLSMEEHWRAGYHDTVRTLRHPEVLERPMSADGVFTFDLALHGRE